MQIHFFHSFGFALREVQNLHRLIENGMPTISAQFSISGKVLIFIQRFNIFQFESMIYTDGLISFFWFSFGWNIIVSSPFISFIVCWCFVFLQISFNYCFRNLLRTFRKLFLPWILVLRLNHLKKEKHFALFQQIISELWSFRVGSAWISQKIEYC